MIRNREFFSINRFIGIPQGVICKEQTQTFYLFLLYHSGKKRPLQMMKRSHGLKLYYYLMVVIPGWGDSNRVYQMIAMSSRSKVKAFPARG